ncbi:MAG: hypothetical protein A3E37_03425 [Candidatus Andersenbacteria bacterium RIFCSPHIGHO2_12_FULL_46_9]|nr:MAG: hypothetical protein UW94_C0009G0006 [Parcubacteria group bacterium GW2011_GWA2_45_14]OGY35137.1 MAG: hypothetical protein A3B76_05570 [Candidatus Andersenbacteria bacterium RIFCSPHIGHO2_02_FULL_46_16]OGY37751.1 MAG: hypothetical protein A3E37_03425 [Candidatus Andersenbacteria bacterium RIFCSPHIGHO2_12_FULL_46_9]HBE90037.1 hypothetical protein [Candidatus Andersenbacteria bacterium]
MLILIADDMTMGREAVQDVLEKMYPNAEFIEASTGEEVMAMINNGQAPDLIVCDHHFSEYRPIAKGTDVIRWLREDMAMSTPVILFTSDSSAGQSLKKEWQVRMLGCIGGLRNVVKDILG